MPFVNHEHRMVQDTAVPGDRCFIEYREIMNEWRSSPRWATVDAIAGVIWPNPWRRAAILAFLVFFVLHVIPYERKKRRENGDI